MNASAQEGEAEPLEQEGPVGAGASDGTRRGASAPKTTKNAAQAGRGPPRSSRRWWVTRSPYTTAPERRILVNCPNCRPRTLHKASREHLLNHAHQVEAHALRHGVLQDFNLLACWPGPRSKQTASRPSHSAAGKPKGTATAHGGPESTQLRGSAHLIRSIDRAEKTGISIKCRAHFTGSNTPKINCTRCAVSGSFQISTVNNPFPTTGQQQLNKLGKLPLFSTFESRYTGL